MTLKEYISTINQRYQQGYATEHTFRGDLVNLLESLVPEIRATNEPKRQSCGAPDYIITKGEIPVGFIEAKDIGDKDLEGKKKTGNQEQFDRYKTALSNLIITDYIDFHFYKDGVLTNKISIGQIENKAILPLAENFNRFTELVKDFTRETPITIKSPTRLAEMMAGKARLMAEIIENALNEDDKNQEVSNLKRQMLTFQKMLIHDLDNKSYSDLYAQTIAYGMFAARYHDPSLPTFSREEALTLIPRSNPFLGHLFAGLTGHQLDTRLVWIVDELVNVFLASDVASIMKNFGKSTKQEDPVVHFYETFLGAYNPKLRKARGVWYTPQPVVNFIVRAVDDILKTEFGFADGLADTSKKKIKVNYQGKIIEKEVHQVQVLDPATGTGTFLAETIKHIHKKYEGMQGMWSSYVENHLIPRMNGFELLMASYTMAHLKLDMLLTDTGYVPTKDQRLRVFLTNSLEEPNADSGTLFGNLLSDEADQANDVKRDTPVMCVIGNPPYSGESANKGEWIMKLMEDYKKEPGGLHKLREQNSKFINDDYVKFLRYGQHYIERNGQGVLAFINPHGFLDNPTFRGMRWNLLKTYDKIYTIDLHGNAKKKETAADGSNDVNVFDIEQGVSINFFIKTGKKKTNELGQVFHYDLYGKRELKYDFLLDNTFKSIPYKELVNTQPNFFFTSKDFIDEKTYNKGFSIPELFPLNSLGLLTKRDALSVDFDHQNLEDKITYFLDETKSVDEVCKRFNLVIKDRDKWDANLTRSNVSKSDINEQIRNFQYRPFDNRKVFYNSYFVARPNTKVLGHFIKENAGLIICRQGQAVGGVEWNVVFTCKYLTDQNIYRRGGGTVFPLYLYPDNNVQQTIDQQQERTPNLNMEIVNQIAEKLGMVFVPEKNSPPAEGCPSGGVVSSPNPQYNIPKEELTKINNIPIYRNFVENLPHNPALKQLSKDKRKEGILSEVLFWQQVHKGVFHKIDFDRQRIIGNYIVDFYIKTLGLVIEIDGNSHDSKQEYDAKRQAYLESFGLKVFRCSDIDVKRNITSVFSSLEKFIIREYGEITTPAFSHPSIRGEFTPIDILDYIYAVLHSPTYREKYKEFLKIDFPRVPYPKDQDTFWKLVELGGEIRQIHLLESPVVDKPISKYPITGTNVVGKIKFELSPHSISPKGEKIFPVGKVYINESQYFEDVPEVAWNFYIGGYQPAQKWLKDRKDRELQIDDIRHYLKIIVALTETDRLMKEVDKIELE
jgi:very-short-patch-repair endonuclease